MQEIYRFNYWKTSTSRPNTQNLKPSALLTKKLQTFQMILLVQWKFWKIFVVQILGIESTSGWLWAVKAVYFLHAAFNIYVCRMDVCWETWIVNLEHRRRYSIFFIIIFNKTRMTTLIKVKHWNGRTNGH